MNKIQIAILAGVPVLLLTLVVFGSDKSFSSYPTSVNDIKFGAPNKQQMPVPTTKIDITKDFKVTLHTTFGDIVIKVKAVDAPIASTNFVYLSKTGFYNGTIFHRVINGFMIQGGDPTGTGSGGPGYSFDNEPFDGDYTRGTVAMANAGPNTNGSQFFIMQQSRNDIPKNYVIFGEVIGGMEVVDKITQTEVGDNGQGEVSRPITPVVINTVDVSEE